MIYSRLGHRNLLPGEKSIVILYLLTNGDLHARAGARRGRYSSDNIQYQFFPIVSILSTDYDGQYVPMQLEVQLVNFTPPISQCVKVCGLRPFASSVYGLPMKKRCGRKTENVPPVSMFSTKREWYVWDGSR